MTNRVAPAGAPAKTSRVIPPAGPQRVLALAQLSNSVGDGAYYVTSALYFTHVVGLAPARVGLGLTVAWAVGSLVGVPLGRLADRRGPRGTAVLLALATSVAVASFLVVRGFVPFVLAACVYASAQSGLAAARQALLAGLVSREERTGLLAHLQSTLNAGLAVGAGLGGLALHLGTREAYLGVFALDAVSFLLCAAVLLRLPVVKAVHARVADEKGRGNALGVLRDRPYALVTLLNTVLLLRMPLLSLGIPLWISERTEAPTWLVSALFVLNTGAVMLFQVRMARGVRGPASATRAVRRSGLVMLASCAVFALSAGVSPWVAVAVLTVGAVLQVVAEMQQSAGSWQLSFDLAPADRVGEYQGFFGTGVTVARTAGPLVLTSLLVGWGTPGWLLLGGLMLAASYAMGPAVRWATDSRPAAAPMVRRPVPVN
ncbi:MFS transporter [Streptomyces phaeochromogenes]|uniref:MFS transporter n=1 Tax=Streptomyces phaeochromogenes TaxID=1923 RepID=UPI00224F8E83|nr:MFS transporter [Streptomyces phaeochromogenes]MCX5604940.1 MFS transporter [Streptomyces phaeochromogenes]WRZ30780.1 MFS transporter [Streptomyces phaeochromogenes]WSJ06808.1 MFS transporter [Streptomyces phaeochromogenes]WSS94896.1 MFS transporter [Streptomyces phaeochromogenes]WSW16131.1 MFS transporter [Streptomyces phaeochromogenes]